MSDQSTTSKRIVWGAPAIAKEINRTLHSTYHMLETGKVPGAAKVGGVWTLQPHIFFETIAARASASAA